MPPRPQDTVARNTAFLLAAQILVKVFAFAALVVLANRLDVATFGLFNFVLAFASLFIPLADLGIDTVLVREMAADQQRRSAQAGTAIRLKLGTAALTFVVILAAYAVAPKAEAPAGLMVLAAILVVLRSLPATISALFRARQLMAEDSLIQVSAKVVEFVAIGAALLLSASLWGLYVCLIAGSLVQLAATFYMARRRGFLSDLRYDRDMALRLVRGGLPFAATGVSVMIYFHIDAVLLAYLVGEAETGLYRAATNVMFAASGFSAAVVLALFPMVAEYHERNRTETVRVAANAVTYSMALAFPIAFGGTALASLLMGALYRSSYAGAENVLLVLLWWLPISFVTNVFGYVLGAIGRQSTVLRVTIINAIFNVLLNLLLIPQLGAVGAAIATVATEVLGWTLLRGVVRREFGPLMDRSRLLRIIVASAPLLLLTFLTPMFSFVVLLAVGIVLYSCCALVVRAVTLDEVRYLLSLARRQPPNDASA
ncbi:MAG: flippase [Bacteroidetes bacterium]|jgi:O-antigen/teichoic acid export membrane protein|nr:flippase [Bacteroidota bacterium]